MGTQAAQATAIAGRYDVDAELARGGMGVVYSAVDRSTGKRVALKQLLSVGGKADLKRMFEREYHTLKSLAHPRIIEVYDYGHADGIPYYTMELLDGQDLRELAPLSYRAACRYLHDVASSVALLHARRLLHRDLSPRNVRVTSDDHCKLIDFGALTGFGLSQSIVGTPPLVPPEALHHAPLDQRADLYSLGALAYWLLTKRHAFAVTTLSELPNAWRQPPLPPSEAAAYLGLHALQKIPKELDDLVMGLLTLDPLGRPSSAAEVMDRFVAIGGFQPEREVLSSQSYLRSPALVGRDREMERLDKRLRATLRRKGACMVMQAPSGMGSSRLLAELALRAQLAGALPILVDATLHRGPYGVVHDLIDKVLRTAPEDAAVALGSHAALLARFSPAVAERLAIVPDATDYSRMRGELRRQTQHALSEWLLALSERRPLVLAIDGLQHADEASAALLASLAHNANRHPLFLLGAQEAQKQDAHTPAIQAIAAAGASMRLRPLGTEQVGLLVCSLFGDVQYAGRLSEWLQRLSGGSPRACLDLVQHLLERNVVRYIDGMWVLPQELLPEDLPKSLDQVIDARLSRLASDARRLAEALCVHHGALSLSRCLTIAEAENVSDAFAIIEELVREGVLVQTGENYYFSHQSVREALFSGLDTDRLKRLHAQLGMLLLPQIEGDIHAMLDAGWHLLHGGHDRQGAELLAKAGIALGHQGDEMPAAVAPLRAALDVFRKQKRSPYELIQLLGPLTVAGLYADRRLAEEFGDETIRLLKRLLGLSLAAKLRPLLGHRFALLLGLLRGVVGFSLRRSRGGVEGFRKTLTLFINCIMSLVGTATICFQRDRGLQFSGDLEILTALGPDHAATITHRVTTLLTSVPQDRQAHTIAGFEELLRRLEDPRPIADLPQDSRRVLHGMAMYTLGALEALRGGNKALSYAAALEALGIRIYTMAADQIRAGHFALRGDTALANQYRDRVELQAVQSGSGWQAEIWAPSRRGLSQGLCRDRIGLKHTMETLDRLSADIPSLSCLAKLTKASYLSLAGDLKAASELRIAVLDSVPPRDVLGWAASTAGLAQNLRLMGNPAQAKERLERALALLDAADRKIILMTHTLFIELAFAHADLGELDVAARILDEQLQEHKDSEAPLVLGNLHAARAQVATRANDLSTALEHVAEMERWYRPTGNPVLIAVCEQARRENVSSEQRATGMLQGDLPDISVKESVRSVLSQCGPREHADRALTLLLQHTRGVKGYLFVLATDGARLLAPMEGEEPPDEVQAQAQAALTRARNSADGDQMTVTEGQHQVPLVEESAYRLLMLSVGQGESASVVGVVAIAQGDRELRTPHPRVLEAIAQSLSERVDAA